MDREKLERLFRKYRDPSRGFSTIDSDSVPYIRSIVEGKFPITEPREKPQAMSEAQRPGDALSQEGLTHEYQRMMHEQRPGAEFEGELFFRDNNPPLEVSTRNELIDVIDNPFMDFTETELEAESLDINEVLNNLERLKKVDEAIKNLKRSYSSVNTEDGKLIAELVKIAQDISLDELSEAVGEAGEGGGGDIGDLGLEDLGLGDLGLGGDTKLNLGKPEKDEKEEGGVLFDINKSILDSLDEQTKRILMVSLTRLKEILSGDIDKISTSELESVLKNIENAISKAKENYIYEEMGYKPNTLESMEVSNVNRFVGSYQMKTALYKISNYINYFLNKLYIDLMKIGARPRDLALVEKNPPYLKFLASIEIMKRTPLAVKDASYKIPIKVMYDAVNEIPIYIETISGAKLPFDKESILKIIEAHTSNNLDYFVGYYNPQFMNKKAEYVGNVKKLVENIEEDEILFNMAKKFYEKARVIPLDKESDKYIVVEEDGSMSVFTSKGEEFGRPLKSEEKEAVLNLINKLKGE